MYYFVRVNGNTDHNNPQKKECYVPDNLPGYPETYFNGVSFCLEKGIIRTGWPDTGDMRQGSKAGALG